MIFLLNLALIIPAHINILKLYPTEPQGAIIVLEALPGKILESSQIQRVGVISIPQLKAFLNFIWLYQIIH